MIYFGLSTSRETFIQSVLEKKGIHIITEVAKWDLKTIVSASAILFASGTSKSTELTILADNAWIAVSPDVGLYNIICIFSNSLRYVRGFVGVYIIPKWLIKVPGHIPILFR